MLEGGTVSAPEVERIIKMAEGRTVVDSRNLRDDGWTSLHYAAKAGDIEVVKLLLNVYHADPKVTSTNL